MGDVEDRMSRKRKREDRQRLPGIANECRGRYHEESNRQRDIEADSRMCFVGNREADVHTRRQDQQQSGELCEPQLTHEPIR